MTADATNVEFRVVHLDRIGRYVVERVELDGSGRVVATRTVTHVADRAAAERAVEAQTAAAARRAGKAGR